MRPSQLALLATTFLAGLVLYLSYRRLTPPSPLIPTVVSSPPSAKTRTPPLRDWNPMAHLQPLTFTHVLPKAAHTASVIFIHGLGDSGAGWLPVASALSRELPYIKWILPNARMQPVTVNGGMPCPSWYDIYRLGDNSLPNKEDDKGMLASVSEINELVTKEIEAGIPSERIVVGGFSQGGALSYLTGLTSQRRLGGIAVLSAYLPLRNQLQTMLSPHATTLPIFQAHGTADPVIQLAWGQGSSQLLQDKFGLKAAEPGKAREGGITFKSYRYMGHSANDEEITDLARWLKEVLPPT